MTSAVVDSGLRVRGTESDQLQAASRCRQKHHRGERSGVKQRCKQFNNSWKREQQYA